MALAAIEELAEHWGGRWHREGSGGRLTLPVSAGLRRGTVSGTLSVEAGAKGLSLHFDPEESDYRLIRPAVFFLVLASAGGLFSMVWPFFAHRQPELLAAVPTAALLALGGWFLVVSRLRNCGPEEFLEEVAEGLTPPKSTE